MPCTCSPPSFLVTEYNTMVCTTCGIESRQMLNPAQDTTYNAPRNPLHQRVYNRPDRWKTLVKKVVGLHNGPPQHDPVWELLKKHAPFTDVAELTKTLRGSRLKHKHYQSLHAFAKAFVPSYTAPTDPPKMVERNLHKYFSHIQHMWSQHHPDQTQFFSYSWLLEQGLHVFYHIGYLPFVKRLICRKRRNKYVKMLATLYETRAETSRRDSSDSRFQSAKSRSSTLRNQLQMHQHLFSHERAGLGAEPSVAGLERALGHRCAALLDAVRRS